jgi:hypothetical protein
LAARTDSLKHHGLEGLCPTVCPATLLPGLQASTYLHIQERGTGRPANKWRVAVVDTGADLALCSKYYAQSNGLEYGANRIPVTSANGEQTLTLGELVHPLEFTLCISSENECTAVAPVQVMDVGNLYDLILSMNIITQWGAYVDTTTSQLVFRPNFWTHRDRKRVARLPIYTSPKSPSSTPKTAANEPTEPEAYRGVS